MVKRLKILATNDDGYKAKGIKSLTDIMIAYGSVSVIAPKKHMSGMSMAVDLGLRQLAYKQLGEIDGVQWAYLDGAPASCIKYGLNFEFAGQKPDLVVSGINHGSNASTGSCYSGTLGAVQEAALNGILGIGVSLNDYRPDADFSSVEKLFPPILDKLLSLGNRKEGVYFNVNFPKGAISEIKGVRMAHQGHGHWVKEFVPWSPDRYEKFGVTPESLGQSSHPELEEGERLLMMQGVYVDDPNSEGADHRLLSQGFVTIVPHQLYNTDWDELERLKNINEDF